MGRRNVRGSHCTSTIELIYNQDYNQLWNGELWKRIQGWGVHFVLFSCLGGPFALHPPMFLDLTAWAVTVGDILALNIHCFCCQWEEERGFCMTAPFPSKSALKTSVYHGWNIIIVNIYISGSEHVTCTQSSILSPQSTLSMRPPKMFTYWPLYEFILNIFNFVRRAILFKCKQNEIFRYYRITRMSDQTSAWASTWIVKCVLKVLKAEIRR